jgi:Fe-S cluster assembly ATP-binding protein
MMEKLHIPPEFLSRSLNTGFSGGEKKKMEILQLLILNPTYAMLDETDSGLDVDALKIVAEGINAFKTKEKGLLLITHYQRLLDYIIPDVVHIMREGKIVKNGGKELVEEIEKEGFQSYK